jgi:hypothetical protein
LNLLLREDAKVNGNSNKEDDDGMSNEDCKDKDSEWDGDEDHDDNNNDFNDDEDLVGSEGEDKEQYKSEEED